MFALYSQSFPALADEFVRRMKGQLPANWTEKMPKYTPQVAPIAFFPSFYCFVMIFFIFFF